MKVLADFHHSSLLRSLVLLFEGRLGMELYRPIGMEWYERGFWSINDQEDTARQFLDFGSQPMDGTPPLNDHMANAQGNGVFYCADPGDESYHKACTFPWFADTRFDYLIASIPAHVPIFEALRARYQPQAKLIVQMGNNWNLLDYRGFNVLASIRPVDGIPDLNACFYHQEFDADVFYPTDVERTDRIYSFVNCLPGINSAWLDYNAMYAKSERLEFRSFGGQCPDGNMNGPAELAERMREAMMVFHVKPGGDGFGHVVHNAYAVGRPIITRRHHYTGQLAELLMVPGTFVDLDGLSHGQAVDFIERLDTEELVEMGRLASERFREVVNYEQEAEQIQKWLAAL